MQKLFLIVAMALALPVMARAQESPRVEIFSGYSYLRLEQDSDVVGFDRDLNGFNVSGNITVLGKSVGIKADISAHYGNFVSVAGLGVPNTDMAQYAFLFGPQFTLRKSERIQPFAHVMAGFARAKVENDAIGLDDSDTGFAFAAGGGVDLKALSRKLSIRLFQADYVLTKFSDNSLVSANTTSSNLRVSAGVVLRFGTVE